MVAIYPPARRRRHQALLRYIAGYQEAHGGVSPTVRNCRDALGLAGLGVTYGLLNDLERDGRIRRLRQRARAIEIIAAPSIPRAPDGAPLFVVPLFHAAPSTVGEQRNHG